MRKSILSLLLATVLILGSVVLPASAAPTAVFVTVNRQTAIIGDVLQWTINVDPAANMQTRVRVKCDGLVVYESPFTTSNVHSYVTKKAGEYVAEAIAYDKTDDGILSKDSAPTTVKLLPAPVIQSVAVTGASRIKLVWSPVSGVDGYRVYISASSLGPFSYKSASTTTSATLTYLVPGKVYYFYVAGYLNDSGGAKVTATFNSGIRRGVALGIVSVATISNPSSGRVRLTWAAGAGATHYVVYRSTSLNGSYARLGATIALSYIDNTAIRGRVYYYRIMSARSISGTMFYGIMGPARSIRVVR